MSEKLIVATSGELRLLITDILNDCLAASSVLILPQPSAKPGTATRQQAAEFFGITLPTLHQYTKSGTVKGNRIGRRVLYRWADLEAALTAIKTNGKAEEVAA